MRISRYKDVAVSQSCAKPWTVHCKIPAGPVLNSLMHIEYPFREMQTLSVPIIYIYLHSALSFGYFLVPLEYSCAFNFMLMSLSVFGDDGTVKELM